MMKSVRKRNGARTGLGVGLVVLCVAAAVPGANGQEEEFDPNEPVYWDHPVEWPDADILLAGVRGALPREPLLVTAELQSKSRSGRLEKRLKAEIALRWGSVPATAEYLIRDAFGSPLERMVVTRGPDGITQYRYEVGEPLEEKASPPMNQPIQGTDIAWADLTLDFLWWRGGRTVGAEKVRGRYCYIVEITVPKDDTGVAGLRLWIEPRSHLLLRAAAYDEDAGEMRRLEVKSLKKVEDMWILKDLEVKTYPSRHKTILRVRTVEREPSLAE